MNSGKASSVDRQPYLTADLRADGPSGDRRTEKDRWAGGPSGDRRTSKVDGP